MAVRPVFLSRKEAPVFQTIGVDFKWYPGFSHSQKVRSVAELHKVFAGKHPDVPILEVSSKSASPLGRALSAFNLSIEHKVRGRIPLESAFQGSKVFAELGQIEHAYASEPRTAKRLAREADNDHPLVEFRWEDESWPLEPKTLFYDWLYCSALRERPDLLNGIRAYSAFTDIEFNPAKSFNCQARSCAIAVGLMTQGHFDKALSSQPVFIELAYGVSDTRDGETEQLSLI